jgi:hypothetical protein
MLVTFSSPAYANITMFGDVALHLLKLMGRRQSVPGALLADDVPSALQQLEAALKIDEQSPEPAQLEAGEDDDEPPVSLSLRALPLVELLKASAKEECNVMWD